MDVIYLSNSNQNLIFLLVVLWGMVGVFSCLIPMHDYSATDLENIGALPKYELYNGNIFTYVLVGIKSVFIHTSIVHLVGNMWLITTGVISLMYKNKAAYNIAIFLVGGVLGNLTFGFLPLDNSGTEWIVGASSGGFALTGFVLMNVFFNKFRFENKLEKWGTGLCLFFAVMSVIDAYSYTTSNVANIAHLTGFIFGIIAFLVCYIKDLNQVAA